MQKIPELDLSAFEKAMASLEEAILEYQKNTNNRFVRDAMIQRFEYTYELSHKTLKRYLEMSEPSGETVDQMSFPLLIRTGAEKGLLQNGWDKWSIYRGARNLTSHTYNENKAIQVCAVIPDFMQEAKYLIQQLFKHLASA